MELDKRVGNYAAEIVRDVDLLSSDLSNLNTNQQKCVAQIRKSIDQFLSLYDQYRPDFAEFTFKSYALLLQLQSPLSKINGPSNLLMAADLLGPISDEHLQLAQRIQVHYQLIATAISDWNHDEELLIPAGIQQIQGDLQRLYAGEFAITDEHALRYVQTALTHVSDLSHNFENYYATMPSIRPITKLELLEGFKSLYRVLNDSSQIAQQCSRVQNDPNVMGITPIQIAVLNNVQQNIPILRQLIENIMGLKRTPIGVVAD